MGETISTSFSLLRMRKAKLLKRFFICGQIEEKKLLKVERRAGAVLFKLVIPMMKMINDDRDDEREQLMSGHLTEGGIRSAAKKEAQLMDRIKWSSAASGDSIGHHH